jgi:hypothetical protein
MVALHHRAKLSWRPRPSQVRRARRSGSVGRRSRNIGIRIRRLPVPAQRKSPSSDEEAGSEQSPADHVPLQPSPGARHNKPDSRAPGPGDSRQPLLGLAWWQSVARGCGHLQAVWHARLQHSEYRASDGHGQSCCGFPRRPWRRHAEMLFFGNRLPQQQFCFHSG